MNENIEKPVSGGKEGASAKAAENPSGVENEGRERPRTDSTIRNRRRSRELALHTLYACEVGAVLDWELMLERIAETNSLSLDVKNYAHDLVKKTMDSLASIDETLSERAANWELRRMAAIDRNILRLAISELTWFSEVPFKVVIDEAVELAKMYGTDESGKFVNGVIDSIYKKISGNSGKEGRA